MLCVDGSSLAPFGVGEGGGGGERGVMWVEKGVHWGRRKEEGGERESGKGGGLDKND